MFEHLETAGVLGCWTIFCAGVGAVAGTYVGSRVGWPVTGCVIGMSFGAMLPITIAAVWERTEEFLEEKCR